MILFNEQLSKEAAALPNNRPISASPPPLVRVLSAASVIGGKKRRGNTNKRKQTHEDDDLTTPIRISASSVAAICGFHPYQNIPRLLFDLVYQSQLSLLQQDASLLGITIVDDAISYEREIMLTLASAVSDETKLLVQTAIDVSEGKTKLQSVDEIQSIQRRIQNNASQFGKLTMHQVDSLVEGSREKLSTGFGSAHEDDALDIYEKKVGCTVRERNEALMIWKFKRVEMSDSGVTARPLGEARRREWGPQEQQMTSTMLNYNNNNLEKENSESKEDGVDAKLEQEKKKMKKDDDIMGSIDIDDDDTTYTTSTTTTVPSFERNHECFFKIVGVVDGIRDEIYIDQVPSRNHDDITPAAIMKTPTNNIHNSGDNEIQSNINNTAMKSNHVDYNFSDDDNNNEQWTLRPIIVECKHRMSQAQDPPPLYDQIQTCLYCHMYNVEEADLIQVVRRRNKSCTQHVKTTDEREGKENDQPIESEMMMKADNNGENVEGKNVQITITRISLNDPIHNHRHHWNRTLLPRLASFVDAVYSIRKDDGKRYRLLNALVQDQKRIINNDDEPNAEAWKVLEKEIPWLKDCDTSFRRGKKQK